MPIVFFLRYDNQRDLHVNFEYGLVREYRVDLLLRSVENYSEVDITIRAMIAAGAGAEEDYLQGVCPFNDAADRFRDLSRRYFPILFVLRKGHGQRSSQ